jgi:hypothetical protein
MVLASLRIPAQPPQPCHCPLLCLLLLLLSRRYLAQRSCSADNRQLIVVYMPSIGTSKGRATNEKEQEQQQR